MACKTIATIISVILMSAHFASTRRVQTEYLIHHPIHANDQKPLEGEASSFIERAASGTKSSSALESGIASQASGTKEDGKTTDKKSTSAWEWILSGGPLSSLVLAISSHVFRDGNADQYIHYCSISIFLVAVFACTCRLTEWLKNRSQEKRNQYVHHGRVIYEWVQTPKHVTFYTTLPKGQTQESLEVKLWPKHAKIGRKGKVAFIKEELYDGVNVDKCSWNVSRKGELAITLVKKMEEQEWPCVFMAHHPDKAVRDQVKSERPQRSPKATVA